MAEMRLPKDFDPEDANECPIDDVGRCRPDETCHCKCAVLGLLHDIAVEATVDDSLLDIAVSGMRAAAEWE